MRIARRHTWALIPSLDILLSDLDSEFLEDKERVALIEENISFARIDLS